MVLHVTTAAPARGSSGKSPHEGGSGSPWPGWMELLAEVPLFRSLPKRDLRRVARLAHLRWYADGWTVTRIGTTGDAFYAVLDGRADVQTADRSTRTLEPGAFFGELALLDQTPRTATVTSAGGLTVARIARADFAQLLREEPAIGLGLARGLATILQGIEATRGAAPSPDVGGAGPGTTATVGAVTVKEQLPVIAGIPLFEALTKRHLRRVLRSATLKTYEEGATVVRAGMRGDAFYVILDGRAVAQTPGGRGHGLEPGDWFGELALLGDAPRSATVAATTRLTTLRIGRTEFTRLLRDEPTIAVGLARGLAGIIRGLQPAAGASEAPARKSA